MNYMEPDTGKAKHNHSGGLCWHGLQPNLEALYAWASSHDVGTGCSMYVESEGASFVFDGGIWLRFHGPS